MQVHSICCATKMSNVTNREECSFGCFQVIGNFVFPFKTHEPLQTLWYRDRQFNKLSGDFVPSGWQWCRKSNIFLCTFCGSGTSSGIVAIDTLIRCRMREKRPFHSQRRENLRMVFVLMLLRPNINANSTTKIHRKCSTFALLSNDIMWKSFYLDDRWPSSSWVLNAIFDGNEWWKYLVRTEVSLNRFNWPNSNDFVVYADTATHFFQMLEVSMHFK